MISTAMRWRSVELAGGYQILTRRAFAAAIEQAQLSVRIPS
jgi:hypothetical protein